MNVAERLGAITAALTILGMLWAVFRWFYVRWRDSRDPVQNALVRNRIGKLPLVRDGKPYQGGPRRNRTSAANKARASQRKEAA